MGGGHEHEDDPDSDRTAKGHERGLQNALLLARRFDSYIDGFALQSRISEFVAVEMGGSFPLDSLKQESIEACSPTPRCFMYPARSCRACCCNCTQV